MTQACPRSGRARGTAFAEEADLRFADGLQGWLTLSSMDMVLAEHS